MISKLKSDDGWVWVVLYAKCMKQKGRQVSVVHSQSGLVKRVN